MQRSRGRIPCIADRRAPDRIAPTTATAPIVILVVRDVPCRVGTGLGAVGPAFLALALTLGPFLLSRGPGVARRLRALLARIGPITPALDRSGLPGS